MSIVMDRNALVAAEADWSRFPLPLAAKLVAEANHALVRDTSSARACLRQLAHLFERCGVGNGQNGDGLLPAPIHGMARGGLAPWQLRLVLTHIETCLSETIHIETLAALTKLSGGHFCRAFKISVGETPHAYVILSRVERAKILMLTTSETLSQIACACGLTDQAHLTRLFRQHVGDTPLSWRRAWRQSA